MTPGNSSESSWQEFLAQDLKFPKQLVIETTAACNLRCIMCPHKDMKRRKGSMDLRLFMKIVKEVAAVAPECEVWMTFMGEALLLRNTIFGMIQYAKEVGCRRVVLNSNATYLDDRAVEGLIESGLDRFLVSLDAATPETYARIRPGGNFEASVRGTEKILERVVKERRITPTVSAQFSVMEDNEHEQEAFEKYWSERGAIVKFRPKCSWISSIEAPNLTINGPDRPPCRWIRETSAVHFNGDMVNCVCDYDGFLVAGNLWERSLQDIWLTDMRELRWLHYQRRFDELPDFCRNCRDWQTSAPIIKESHLQVQKPRD